MEITNDVDSSAWRLTTTTTTTSAAICPGMPSTKITPFTPKLGLSLTPVATTNNWECHSTRIALTADIEKAFLQVKIKEEDRRYLRFYHLRNPEDEDQGNGQLAVYHFNVNIFGSPASSFIIAAVLQHHLKKNNLEHTALDIGRKILVDNLVTGTDTEEEAKNYFKRTRKIFQEASMNIREWTSNHPNIMNHLEQQGIAGKRDTHVLGLQWTTKEDQLSLEPFKQHSEAVWTKRKIFSQFATLFDPFGWTTPATLKTKLFIKRTLERKLDMGRGTTETEERRMEHNCRRFSQCNIIRETQTHNDYTEKLRGHLCG